jgi:hypothetical protein
MSFMQQVHDVSTMMPAKSLCLDELSMFLKQLRVRPALSHESARLCLFLAKA